MKNNKLSESIKNKHANDSAYAEKIANQLRLNGLRNKGTRQPKTKTYLEILRAIVHHHSDKKHNYLYSIKNHDIGKHDKIRVYCLDHKIWFETQVRNHLPSKNKEGSVCPVCRNNNFSKKFLKTKNEFLQSLLEKHGEEFVNKVSYSDYSGSRTPIKCSCNKCNHEYFQLPNDILTHGYGCPNCANTRSKAEEEIYDFLLSLNINKEEIDLRDRKTIKPLELDIYLPKFKLAIEHHGLFWHSEQKVGKRLHYDKYVRCKELGIRLIQVYEDEWINKKQIVKNLVIQALGMNNSSKIYARNCSLKEISSFESKNLLNKYHIQGFSNGKHYLGLFHSDELVAAMVLGSNKSLRGDTDVYELIRYATKYNVIGGMSKLFKYFIRQHSPDSVITYSDNDKFSGNSYLKLGFKPISLVKPNYYSIWGKLDRRHKSSTKKDNLAKLLGDKFDGTKTEFELFDLVGGYRVWNSGQIKWEWNNND